MDYPLENLTPEQFQSFCQSLLAREYPDLQCFPVAQPDGGRDAIAFIDAGANSFNVFQVKFVRRPETISEPHKWLEKVVEAEAPKVSKLMAKGAKRYTLITNINGTAHLEAGSIDKVQEILSDNFDIPAICWWRDDLNRRLDNAWELKWVFPVLMTGPDLLRAIIENGLSEKQEIRSAAIRAFICDQYDLDREVRFKQIELQNRLLSLFVDVPLTFSRPEHFPRTRRLFISARGSFRPQLDMEAGGFHSICEPELIREATRYRDENTQIGAAAALLGLQEHFPRVVIEGAPGQGKSTIVQYICQVHRMRLINHDDLALIPEHSRNRPVRLPFKVDLRDLSSWLTRKNPFSSTEEIPANRWHKSLESFLAAQVEHHSGGIAFDTADLLAVAKLSSILLVFDGLDEVADINRRREVVEEISRGVNRLEANASSIQVIVTSRPAAFANSPGLPSDTFPHLQLDSLTRSIVDQYADKWLEARRIIGRERAEFRRVLREKLDQPHLRDLARNPMQLAILLSLILTRGSSLPDKRTALYDNYIELFFSRESEKSAIVREHRYLLIDIHQYLGWRLHAEAEEGGTRGGSITSQDLHSVLREYLTKQGHDGGLAETLFTGMVERVVALVSRVEGTYEFEVQPLREYFAARFLYETAPYSPPGAEKRGTKPDRFDAIARNFYWLNVTRFYAGCFSKGELASLIDRLQEFAAADGFRRTSNPRILAAMLLSDWVFTQHPRSVREVLNLTLDGIGLRFVLTSTSRRVGAGGAPLVLPKQCGRDELVEKCFNVLRQFPPDDYALDVIDVLIANSTPSELMEPWLRNVASEVGTKRTIWLTYGLYMQMLAPQHLSLVRLQDLCGDSLDVKRLEVLFRARRLDYFEASEEVCDATINAILDGELEQPTLRSATKTTEKFANALNPVSYIHEVSYAILDEFSTIILPPDVPHSDVEDPVEDRWPILRLCKKVCDVADREIQRSTSDWITSLEPWDNLVEASRATWGRRWAHFTLAAVASGIRSSSDRCAEATDLFDESQSLCRRARYARLRTGTSAWWKRQLGAIRDDIDAMFFSLMAIVWGGPSCIAGTAAAVGEMVDHLDASSWRRLARSLRISLAHQAKRRESPIVISSLPPRLSARLVVALSYRLDKSARQEAYTKFLMQYGGDDPIILEFCQWAELNRLGIIGMKWEGSLKVIRNSYRRGVVSERFANQRFARRAIVLPLAAAGQITDNPADYPAYLVSAAEARAKSELSKRIVPVSRIAKAEGWFD